MDGAEGFLIGLSKLEEESESEEVSAVLAAGFLETEAEAVAVAFVLDVGTGGGILTGVRLGGGLSALLEESESESEEELCACFLDGGCLGFVFTAAFARLGLGLAGRDLAGVGFLAGGCTVSDSDDDDDELPLCFAAEPSLLTAPALLLTFLCGLGC